MCIFGTIHMFEPENSRSSWRVAATFVCIYISYFQSLIYFRTELLTRVKFSRHVWTGFCGPTDGKWSNHKILSILSSIILKVSSVQVFADIVSVV